MKKLNFKILGGGFSGLSLAWYLSKNKNHTVSIYEKEGRLGGLLGSANNPNLGIAEKAANGIMNSDLLMELCEELGLNPIFSKEAAKKRFIERNGPQKFPLNFSETLDLICKCTPMLWRGKNKLLPLDNETLKTWGYRNLGEGATQWLIKPAMNGIYAGDVNKMSAKLIISSLIFNKPKSSVKGLLSFKNGMQELIDSLEIKLKENNVQFFLNHKSDNFLEKISEKSSQSEDDFTLIISTSAWSAAEYLENTFPEISHILKKVEALPLITVTAFFNKPMEKYQGFGCLFADHSKTRALGVLMNSNIYDHRGPKYSESWIFGGALDLNIFEMSDDDLKSEIIKTRKTVFDNSDELIDLVITRWPMALPHYTVELENLIPKLNQSKVQLHGNYLSGIGLSHILSRSKILATNLSEQ